MTITDPPVRADLPREQTWDIEAIFATPDAWEQEAAAFPADLEALKTFQGRLGESPDTLAQFFQTDQTLRQRLGRLLSYASMTASVDGHDTVAADRRDRGNVLASQYTAVSAFSSPELLGLDEATLREWLKRPELQEFSVPLERLWRTRPHVRSAEVEELLGALGSPFGSARNIHPTLANMDLDFGSVDGVRIGHGNIDALTGSADRETRRLAWEQYADAHLNVKHGMAAALATGVRQNVFTARARNYPDALTAALSSTYIPSQVFHTLIETYQANLSTWHRYWAVRARWLGLERLREYDVKAPLSAAPRWSATRRRWTGSRRACSRSAPTTSTRCATA
ncbi:M3 family oligoendopeptidase [Deinococcus sp. KNUC1210]|uniref:M3 family oligoendopeptidase n=1 Tax=Deinococcus sp. KNUC1210 TaxID=2917691 RepID=UPI00351D7935